MTERRREPRIPVELASSYVVTSNDKPARLVDVSPSGALISGDGSDLAGEHPIALDFGHGAPLCVFARTVRNEQGRFAVSFEGMQDVDRLRVAERIDSLVATPDP